MQRELDRFTGIGLTYRHTEGNRAYYQADPEHALFRELRALVLKTAGRLDRVRAAVAMTPTQEEAVLVKSIELIETEEFGNVLLLDKITQVVEKNDWQYHETMVHPAMLSHPDPRDVLVIGGGDGGILREVLRYKGVKAVDFVELDEEVVAFSKEYLPHINGGAFSDPRVRFRFRDGRAF
ncbi:MAG: hypothetical protein HC888_04460, partial [Candidatus Competibacteraceae bacterium]|nr:hypothetical protein [Candidatus Competibacteraceae bacterium]